MSVYSGKSNLTSILKNYTPRERERQKNAIINKVRFDVPQRQDLRQLVLVAIEDNDFGPLNEFTALIREMELTDSEFCRIYESVRSVVYKLDGRFVDLVEALLSKSWISRSSEATKVYSEFCMDVIQANNKYTQYALDKLIAQWLPDDADNGLWPNGIPVASVENGLQAVHTLLGRILTVIPMTFNAVLDTIELKFPYYKKPSHVIVGYLHNILRLVEYKPIFTEFVLQLLLQKMLVLDVNAPRSEIEDMEDEDEDEDGDGIAHNENEENMDNEIFQMDDCEKAHEAASSHTPMRHHIANTLDICMEKLFSHFEARFLTGPHLSAEQKLQRQQGARNFFNILLRTFDNVILPSHNTHHVQFLIFHYCNSQPALSEVFLASLWQKVLNPNVSGVIRQAAIGYMASFLSRSKNLSIATLKYYLKEMCSWAHQYIERSDQSRSNGRLKAHLVFFSACQAIFYVIAFRSRVLTADRKSLLFLQSLQLSALVTCHFNPLRVCLPAVATAFAGVTRAYQLAYCHVVLERNARRKLATVYANETATPEEVLDTFFPFDPYLLKMSGHRIEPFYLQYQASAAEEEVDMSVVRSPQCRKRGDSEMAGDDVDDFLLIADKRQRFNGPGDAARSFEHENQFTYGLSPGFHS